MNAVAVSADGKLIAGGSFDGSITLWDATGKELATLLAPKARILNLAISPDTQELVAGCGEGNAFLFDLAQHGEPKVLKGYTGLPSYWMASKPWPLRPMAKALSLGG